MDFQLTIDTKKIAALIPARGGSKGVSRKNIKILNSRPLISFSIDTALRSPYIDTCYVSTEDSEIATVSEQYGAKVIPRPSSLATDDALTSDVLVHAINYWKDINYYPDFIVLLQPTSPLRTEQHLSQFIEGFFTNNYLSGISVIESEHHPYKMFISKEEQKELRPLFSYQNLEKPRQQLPTIFRQNGAIYMVAVETFLQSKSFFLPPVYFFEMDESSSIDIDSEFDFKLASILLEQKRVP